jgi:hypothetical protein
MVRRVREATRDRAAEENPLLFAKLKETQIPRRPRD